MCVSELEAGSLGYDNVLKGISKTALFGERKEVFNFWQVDAAFISSFVNTFFS